MPVIKSAIKKARQDVRARKHNRVIRDSYKQAAKNFRKLAAEGNTKKANDALAEAYSAIDKAAKKNVLHKNNAGRRKSRLAALLGDKKKTEDKKPVTKSKSKSKTEEKKEK